VHCNRIPIVTLVDGCGSVCVSEAVRRVGGWTAHGVNSLMSRCMRRERMDGFAVLGRDGFDLGSAWDERLVLERWDTCDDEAIISVAEEAASFLVKKLCARSFSMLSRGSDAVA
jgi:hypothetical protein